MRNYTELVKANVSRKQRRALLLRARLDQVGIGEVVRRALDAYLGLDPDGD